jgi:hypothetical protein
MVGKSIAALTALTLFATPCAAFDSLSQQQSPGVMFYLSVPLDAPKAKEQTFNAGFAIQGKRPYETVRIDSRLVNNFIGGGITAKFLIAGVVAAGAAAAVAGQDKSTSESYSKSKAKQAKKNDQGHDPNHPGHYPGDGCSACDPNHK